MGNVNATLQKNMNNMVKNVKHFFKVPYNYYVPQNVPQQYVQQQYIPEYMKYTPQNYAQQFTKEDLMEMVDRTMDPAIWESVTNVDWSPVTKGFDWSRALSFINNADWAGLVAPQAKRY